MSFWEGFVQYGLSPLLLVVLFAFGAFWTASETAWTSLSKIKARQMKNEGRKNSRQIVYLRNRLDMVISTSLVGTNLMTTLTTSVMTAWVTMAFGKQYLQYGTIIVTVVAIIFMQIIPKTFAAFRTEEWCSLSVWPILFFQKLLFPVIFLFDLLAKFINFLETKLNRKHAPLVTEEELKTLLEVGKKEGTLESDEKKMMERIFEFSDLHVHDIMKHRSLIKYIDVNFSIDQVVNMFSNSGYSRLPVCDGNPEKVLGVLHYKQVLFADRAIKTSPDFLRICMNEVMYVPETFSAVELLQKFKKEKENFAVVIDEYGSIAGIVTMDDILKEVFGRMTDEFGGSELSPEQRIQVVSTNEFIVPGDMKTDEVEEVLNIKLESEVYDTLGGWLLERFDELPPVGAVYFYKEANAIMIVDDQSARRIQQVRIKFKF